MADLDNIEQQIDNGQALTGAQAGIFWDALSQASTLADKVRQLYLPTPEYLAAAQNLDVVSDSIYYPNSLAKQW